MPRFTTAELCEIVLLYGECGRNARQTARQYGERFPERRHLSHVAITRVLRRFMDTGSVLPRSAAREPRNRVDDAAVLAYFVTNPHASIRAAVEECGLSHRTIWKILHKHGYHPYHLQPVQALHPNDANMRFDYCNEMLARLERSPEFLQNVMWTDESKFTRDGIVNRHNLHYWATANPHWTRATHQQVRWSINVWCGIWNNTIIGPHFYDGTLNGAQYAALLVQYVGAWADELPLAVLRDTWFQQDGAPPHKVRAVSEFLTTTFGNQWMGQHGPLRWPPRSPDLTPLDFFLWGYLKDVVYATPPIDINDLRDRVVAACRRVTPLMLQTVMHNMEKRLQTCIVVEGRHIEHIM